MNRHRVGYMGIRYLLRIGYALVGHFEFTGHENVPRTGPTIVCPNHTSYLDPPLIGACLTRTTHFMTKADLFENRFLGTVLPYCQAYPIRRGAPDRAALRHTFDLLSRGELITIFPEGVRSRDGNLQSAELGVAMIALRSGAAIVPAGIQGAYEMLPADGSRRQTGRLQVTFGPPLEIDDLRTDGGRESLNVCADRIMAAIARLTGKQPPEPLASTGTAPRPSQKLSPSSKQG